MKAYVQLGKYGDIIALLPMLYALAQRGEKNKLVVSYEFAPVLEGVGYVESVVHAGPHYEIAKAAEMAKAHGEVIVSQVNGPREVVAQFAQKQAGGQATDSFVKEMWRMAGQHALWRECPPLVFDRRNQDREAALCEKHLAGKKTLLVALGGKSSPFPYSDLCLELLRLKFCRYWNVVDLSQVKAERIFDLLGLYEKAKLLVAADSAPLHLANAVPTLPVIALINDQPSLWHGSAWRPNHHWTCRYGDFPQRAVDMLAWIDRIAQPGSYFSERPSPGLFHVWNRAEERPATSEVRQAAADTWKTEYEADARWVSTPVHVGAVGRESGWVMGDTERHPFLKAALQLPLQRARPDDWIVLTRSTTCFTAGLGNRLTNGNPHFARRLVRAKDIEQFAPTADLFSATKAQWQKILAETPDLVLGRDHYWSRLLMEVFRMNSAVELNGSVYTLQP